MTTLLYFEIATADVKGAHTQSGKVQREIYIFVPMRPANHKPSSWKLGHLPYSIVEAGSQWLCVVENWLLDQNKLSKTSIMRQVL